jgi:GrpB-like predicted nucleotidyltransferase (UPF0157 family)/GNAT superfamily N-acetyltransferase
VVVRRTKVRKQIEVVPYNQNWPKVFLSESSLIREYLGNSLIDIHHIGSTSVPGMDAKPIIDIIVVVNKLEESKEGLLKAAYQYRSEHDAPFRLYFTKRDPSNINLHVYEKDNPEIEINILFRDYLRKSPDACVEYSSLKRELIAQDTSHKKNNVGVTGYNLGKNEFIKRILQITKFSGVYLRICQHDEEWARYHHIRIEQLFKPTKIIYDSQHPTITVENQYHFVLYKGVQIVSVAQIEILNIDEAAIRSLATDKIYKKQGYATIMMNLLEKWMKEKGIKLVRLHASPAAEKLYRKFGYDDLYFDDIGLDANDIDLGKKL